MWKGSLDKKDLMHLADGFRQAGKTSIHSLTSAAQAYLAWGLYEAMPGLWVWVVDTPRTLEILHQDIMALSQDRKQHVLWYPAREVVPGRRSDSELAGDRLDCLQRLAQDPGPAILLTCVHALMQRTLSSHTLSEGSRALSISHPHDPEELTAHLQDVGYEFTHEVHERGEAARRGGLLDVWVPTEDWPTRIEFFGDVVESIRSFDPLEQTSIEKRNSIRIPPAMESTSKEPGSLLDYLSKTTSWVWCEPDALKDHAETYETEQEQKESGERGLSYEAVRSAIDAKCSKQTLTLTSSGRADYRIAIDPGESVPILTGSDMQPDLMEQTRRTFVHGLVQQAKDGARVQLFFDTEGAMERFVQMFPHEIGTDGIDLQVAPLSEGFVYPAQQLVVVSERDLYGYQKTRQRQRERNKKQRARKYDASQALASWIDMQPGDLVVHADHGVGKYLGLYEIEFHGVSQEVLAVEYAEQAKLYVPTSQIHLLSRYIGVGRNRPNLHRLGSVRWSKQKDSAEKSVEDLAAALLATQASREALAGYAYPRDTIWQHEFETAFPYEETGDQERAIREVKEDMESTRPMDRLICGDVGYGKTEVAMRAAFKAVMDGKQVAVLVPTTVLAQQHYYTFCERMSAFPVAIEMLSRFRTRAEQHQVIRGLREGAVDIVIGTHRLVQGDIVFKELGLVVIDEEQRFGVTHKESLKELRQLVDVLTLTATPIPRTLYMSLTGAKDMSTIQTPPQERLPIETIVTQNDDDTVRQAILHEINRGGQVFYLHNRVKTIHKVQQHLKKIVPEAKVGVAHGQMGEKDLASIMRRFVEGQIDVLLCTTIIESGVDIPNVNTILIDRADRFGLADLYQLRGRVGRYKHKAYAYLLLPKHGRLFDSARKRIGAIRRYSSLGAGFKLALRDLEIRGAGNLLGSQQSGHIAAVGFDLYCQLLRRAVALKKGEAAPVLVNVELTLDFIDLSPQKKDTDGVATIPYSYIEDENHRLNAYRQLAQATAPTEVDRLKASFRDRFGPLPAAMQRLLDCSRIRTMAAKAGIQAVEVIGTKVMLTRNNDYLMTDRKFPRLTSHTASQKLKQIMKIIREWA